MYDDYIYMFILNSFLFFILPVVYMQSASILA